MHGLTLQLEHHKSCSSPCSCPLDTYKKATEVKAPCEGVLLIIFIYKAQIPANNLCLISWPLIQKLQRVQSEDLAAAGETSHPQTSYRRGQYRMVGPSQGKDRRRA
jgi:hypothetical protein